MFFVQCSATWFLVATGFVEAATQQHQQLKLFPTQGLRCLPNSSFLKIAKETLFIDLTLCEMETVERMALSQWSLQPKNLLDTRSAVSAKLKLSQLSTLQRRDSSLIWPFATMETLKRMVLLQVSLADIRMCALSSVLVVDMSSIAARMSYLLATLARHWTRANVFSSSMAKVQCSATWFLVATGFLEALTQQHQQLRLIPTQGLKCLPNAGFVSFQHCQGDILHWSDPLPKWKLWREWFSHLHDALSSVLWIVVIWIASLN